ncbi:MAG: 2-amino-4-hydroxy-6-hydroxymethyldihydropteridine diphosphokinase [Gammaproteobacteria bacterium]|nr:2-amino-4-hydroxy-6-hydroxymethyldihydropteridine diphosphokinase [Gammaproteobacteria bacterium]
MAIVFIGMGSNLDQPRQQLSRALMALQQLPQTRLLADSGIFQSKAMTLADDPEPQPDYLNAVVKLDTQLQPYELLDRLQAIESAQGRQREKRWGARTLDLDILLYENIELHEPRLSLPHPGMAERDFVLYPLFKIAPTLEIPGRGALTMLLGRVSDENLHYLGDFE